MNSNEQKLIINNLLSSGEIFARCAGIIKDEYFAPEYRKVIKYIMEYTEKYGNTPTFDLVNAKHDLGFKQRTVTLAETQSSCDDIEQFCKQSAVVQAMVLGMDDIETQNYGPMIERLSQALMVSLQKDMGIDMYENPEEYLLSLIDTDIYYSTGIYALDEKLDGGLARKQFTLFAANSGVGKSVMLSNLGVNYSVGHGLNVVYISLELAEPMIYKRNAFIMTATAASTWKEKISFMASKITSLKNEGAGSFRVKRLPTGCCVNDIRSFLKQYEIETGIRPDVIIIDYLDLLSPNEGVKNMNISEQDKLKAEQCSQLLHDYNAIGISASQQNREALKTNAPDQSVIAGGMTKVNTVDNFISLFMTSELRAKGEIMAFFLKTRSSDGVGKMVMLAFDAFCLRITDPEKTGGMGKLVANMAQRKKQQALDKAAGPKLAADIGNLPGLTPVVTPTARLDKFLDNMDNAVKVETNPKKRENIANLDKLTKGKAKTIVKAKSGLELLEEEEKLTQYGKTSAETPPFEVADSGKILSDEQNEFIKNNGLGKDCVEYIMDFMG